MQPDIRVVDDVPAAFADFVTMLAPRTFALTGGGTAQRCYDELGRRGDDWGQTAFLLSDERWVPVDHQDSNEGQARRRWLDHVSHAGLTSMRGDGDDRAAAASAYEAVVAYLSPIDLCHLGLGDDGHAASLFPGASALDVTDRLVVPVADEHHEWPRLSFTYRAIEACRTVAFTVTGPEKRDAFRRVVEGDQSAPAAAVRAGERLIYFVGPEVASGT